MLITLHLDSEQQALSYSEEAAKPFNPKTAKARIKQLQRLITHSPKSKFVSQRKAELRQLMKKLGSHQTKTIPKDPKVEKARAKRIRTIQISRKVRLPANYMDLHVEERAAYAEKVIDGISDWVGGAVDYASANSQFVAQNMLHTAKILGVLETKPRTMYRRLTFKTKSFTALRNGKTIRLKPRNGTSWCKKFTHAKNLDLPDDVEGDEQKVTLIIKHHVKSPHVSVLGLCKALRQSVPNKHGELVVNRLHGMIRTLRSEHEVMVAKNGGMVAIKKDNVELARMEGRWLAPKSAHQQASDYVTLNQRINAARRELKQLPIYKKMRKARKELTRPSDYGKGKEQKWKEYLKLTRRIEDQIEKLARPIARKHRVLVDDLLY